MTVPAASSSGVEMSELTESAHCNQSLEDEGVSIYRWLDLHLKSVICIRSGKYIECLVQQYSSEVLFVLLSVAVLCV